MKYTILDGETLHEAYARNTAEQGLYCIAFFGHNGTKAQKKKLYYIWKRLLKLNMQKELAFWVRQLKC